MKSFAVFAGVAAVFMTVQIGSAQSVPVREPWTTSRIKGAPDPPKPYVPETVFTNLKIENGVEMIPHKGRLFVMELNGKIWSFPEKDTTLVLELFHDLKLKEVKGQAFSMAFHPNKQEVFLTYATARNVEGGNRLSRFGYRSSDSGALVLDSDSEEIILKWRSGGHHGGNVQFGPDDGFLYLSTGDAAPPNPPDSLNTGQDNSDILCCILRIDIDDPEVGNQYEIPKDNPFVDIENVRPEIWAFGLRQPWKMSFDSRGRLWVGEVGWELREMIHLVEKGGNYGWSAMEGDNPVKPETASALVPITPPVAPHPHTEAASITGGFEYTGARLPGLRGAYIYGDYETGIIWALRHDGKGVVEHTVIADTPHKISTFGLGNDGELYYIHYGEDSQIYRLAINPKSGQQSDFPRKLSESGLFSNVARQTPAAGVYPFDIHEPMWEDGAKATRYIALPEDRSINTHYDYRENGSYRATTTWPSDAVLARTIQLGEKPVETQMLHFDGDAWNGYSYRWNDDSTDASLVEVEGEEFEVPSTDWKGGSRYRIVSRAECMRCHNMWNKFTPAFEPMQLAGFTDFPRQPAREVATSLGLANARFFHKDEARGKLTVSRDSGSLEKRARSWLHANCAHCHRRHGGGSAPLEINFDRTLTESVTLWQAPTRGDFGLSDARVIVPGQPSRSVLNYRVSTMGNGHMPPLGPREVHEHGAQLLWDWIKKMPIQQGTVNDSIGYSDTTAAMESAHRIAIGDVTGKDRAKAITEGLSSPNGNVRALFERFRPPHERPQPKKLDPGRLLNLTGDAVAGAKLLSSTGQLASCLACHKIGKNGGVLGPDLTQVGSRLNRQQLLESLTEPSKTIAPEYRLWIVETKNGDAFSGFLIDRTEAGLTLKLATGQKKKIPADEIDSTKPQPFSLMPGELLDLLTEQEAVDLLAYLESLR